MAAYYNEHDKHAAAWLRELIKAGLIADGEVDERDIQDVQASDVQRFVQCHWFAGIGGWSYALRLAGWADDRPVWTGSCPCQPFSSAGKGEGGADNRHLWPHWARLIAQSQPVAIFGEQVESAIAHGWFDAVCDDLEREGYACGAACLPAGSIGAPHIRQRLWWVAQSLHAERRALDQSRSDGRNGAHIGRQEAHGEHGTCGEVRELAISNGGQSSDRDIQRSGRHMQRAQDALARGGLGDRLSAGSQGRNGTSVRESAEDGTGSGPRDSVVTRSAFNALDESERQRAERTTGREGCAERAPSSGGQDERRGLLQTQHSGANAWTNADWLYCRDGKYRPVEPGTFPLAHGLPARVGRLRGYGNAIVPQVAAEVIRAYMEIAA